MRLLRSSSIVLVLGLMFAIPWAAVAQSMDLELWRLGNPRPIKLHDDTQVPGDPLADERFRMLMVDMGLALHPTPAHPANTLGRAGGAFEIALRMPQIHPDATVGDGDCPPGNAGCRVWVTRGTNPNRPQQKQPPARLVLPELQVRKGLPFSFELNTRAQYLSGSSAFALSSGLRWALNEGFDFLPDLSVGGRATRVMGTRDFGLTMASADVLVGKWFGIAGSASIAPYIGWQRVWISAISGVIDFDPGNELPQDPTRDDTVFADVTMPENVHDRVVFGLRARSYVGQILFEGSYTPAFLDLDPTLNFVVQLGLDF